MYFLGTKSAGLTLLVLPASGGLWQPVLVYVGVLDSRGCGGLLL